MLNRKCEEMKKRHAKDFRISHSPGIRLAIAFLCLASSACYGYASIERRSAPILEALIERSDEENLFVTLSEGQEQTVNRADVVDIAHPGKVRLTTGMMIAAAGVSLLIYGLVHNPCSGGNPGDSCEEAILNLFWIEGGVSMIVGGGVLATTGGFTYYNSVTAAKPSPAIPSRQAIRHSLPRLTCSFCSH
jgi:hypothetical protein